MTIRRTLYSGLRGLLLSRLERYAIDLASHAALAEFRQQAAASPRVALMKGLAQRGV